MKIQTRLLIVLLAAWTASAVHAQNIIQNGSFEHGSPPWYSVAPVYIVHNGDMDLGFGPPFPHLTTLAPTDGGYAAAIDGAEHFNQNLSLTAGTTYTVSFDLSPIQTWPTASGQQISYLASVDFIAGVGDVSTGEQLEFSYNTTTFGNGWVRESFTFTPSFTRNDYVLFFIGDGTQNSNSFLGAAAIDNVVMSASAIPEPSTYAAICGAGVLLAAWARRRGFWFTPARRRT